MARKWSLLLLTLVASGLVSSQINHQGIHDQLTFSIETIPLDNGVERETSFQPIRITPYFVNDRIDASLPTDVFGPGGPLEQGLNLLSQALSVRRLQGNLVFQPTVSCGNETEVCVGAGAGSCTCDSATAILPSLVCAEVPFPNGHIGTAETQICNVASQQCVTVGPNGAGLADTDFVLYVTALQTDLCSENLNTYTYASACAVDPGGTPIAGHLNVCPQNIPTNDPNELTRLFTREVLHVLGFSAKLFPSYGETVLGEQVYKGQNQRAVVSSKVVEYAKNYYQCDTLGGVFLEDSSSHWDTRILLPELMTRQFYPVYSVLSGFTLALLEDSGWYQANYTVAERTVNGDAIPLLYGKGFGCPFVYDDCLNEQAFPYACSPAGSSRDWCSFDGVHKAVCEEHPATDGCLIPMPDTTVNADCRSTTANIQDSSLEVAGEQSLCFRSSFYTASTPSQPLSDPTAACYKVHPFFDGTNHRYAVETAADDVTTVLDVDYTCSMDGEGVNATSGSPVLGGALWCGYLCNVLGIYGDATVESTDYCHSSCKSCLRGNDSTACTSCSDDSLEVAGDPAGPCQPPEGTVRLEEGPSADRGRVEVFTSGLWRSICVDTWDIVAANLVCVQLGYLRAEEAYLGQGGVFGEGSGPILEELQCTGAETILQQCTFNVAVGGNCLHSMDAAVVCTDSCSGTRFSSDDVYSMTYAVNGETITFTLQAPTTGWVGIGFSHDQLMPDLDVVIGAANSQGSFVFDGYTSGRAPTPDTSQDITATSAAIRNGVTTVTFRRERVTGDPSDVSLDQCVYFRYAWGGEFNVSTQEIRNNSQTIVETSSTMICLPSASVCPATCIFGTYLELISGLCVVNCNSGTIGDSDTRECRNISASDINSAGYTVNATKYEAALFVEESTNMVAEGTYLFTIGIIPVTLDISTEFIGAVSGTGTVNINFQVAQGASVDQLVVTALDPLPVGVYTFSISLAILDFITNPDLVVSHVTEAEVRALPPPRVCDATICENNGTCSEIAINNQVTFSCACAPGWTGLTCADDIDECAEDPCQNEGQCMNMQNAYLCLCPSNFMGVNCEEDRDECVAFAPCQNGGNCNNTFGDYDCLCPDNWMGKNCTEDVNECLNNPCQNSGSCENEVGSYNCTCMDQWTGTNCDVDVDECLQSPCQNGGTCTNSHGLYNCTCPDGWIGMNCEEDVNECSSDPCLNGGTCNNTEGIYSCLCTAQWNGPNCDVDIDECLQSPCLNGGTCNNTLGDYLCLCLETWTGKDCEEDVDECTTSDPCVNGVCNNTDGGYGCTCDSGWTGMNCDEDINECNVSICQNGGTCTNSHGLYNCTCREGWTGTNCEEDVNECSSDPCLNGGTCNNTEGSYSCLCTAQWNGSNCDVDVDECLQSPCLNGGTCNNTLGDYLCLCLETWTGQDCEENVDECTTSDPCVNGVCNNTDGGYSCTCDSGWTGMNCDEDINECDFFPCQNGGTCNNTLGSFFCTCPAEWTDSNCQTDINECSADPCLNGRCQNIAGNFICFCNEGWTDTLCDVDVNECNLSPPRCNNNGTCTNTQGSFNCTCPPGFSGPTCSEDIRDPCSEMPCQNGNCSQLNSTSYICVCDPDYTGMLECTLIDNCRNISCGNGSCVDGVNSYMCDCDEGFKGSSCEVNINDCEPNPCQQNATCIDLINDYLCNCPDGYSGKDCETDINLCDPNPCENQGTCNGTFSSYTCECVEPFIGPNCSERRDLCEPGICQFNGSCMSDGFTYMCDCYDNYYGLSCEFLDLCTFDPCQNEGNCTRLNGTMGYTCDCPFPFSGPNCTTIIDACVALEPCVNGNCSSTGQGTYSCDCNPGWTGGNCDVDIMDCAMSPCVNGECMDTPGSYNCSCYQGWEGRHCDEDIDYCLPTHMCQNNGTCVDGNSTYTCNCSLVDYEGEFCDIRINDCMPPPCQNNGTCFDAVRDYICFCPDEYMDGRDCSTFEGDCVEVMSCQNNGTCVFINGRNECDCPSGWTGYFCNEDINECANNPCNSGICNNTDGSFSCACPVGYAGMLCTIRNCAENPCQNGQCMSNEAENTNFTCVCNSGYTGNLCEFDINECLNDPDPCGVGNCTNIPGSFTCDCPPSRTGSVCETEVDFCANVNCGNGICMNLSDTYYCVCNQGYTGANCGSNIDDCVGINCSDNGNCMDLINGFQCVCNLGYTGRLCTDTYTICEDNPCNATGTADCINDRINEVFTCICHEGYTGSLCDTLISHCAMTQSPCSNNGICRDILNGFTCDCAAGFSGSRCQSNIDECATEPCQNFGTCVDGINSFTCFCTDAWNGTTCEDYVFSGLCDAVSPCANGGRCTDTVDSYECDCIGDYTGENCTVQIDHCEQNPCQMNATCLDGVQTYTCLCPPGYTGRDCDELRGTPTNCTADSDCGFGYFCQRSCPTDSYPAHDTLLMEPLTLVGESSLFVPVNRYPTVMVNFTLITRFRQDPRNGGYIFYYSSDAVTDTFGVLLDASSSQVKILYHSRSNGRAVSTIGHQYFWNDNAYHTLAVAVNDAGNGMFDVVVIMDGFYLGYDLLDIDLFATVGTDDPVLIVGSRLPLPGSFRFVGRIIQVALFETALSRDAIVDLMDVFNHLSGVVGTCVPHLNEGDRCPIPVMAASSLCDTTTERCNPAERCLPNVLGEFECRHAPIECDSDTDCDAALLGPAFCGGLEFPRYGQNFYERSDSRIAGMLQYLQLEPMEFDYNTPPRFIASDQYPNVTKDLTIFALVQQGIDNNGYVVAKESSSSNRDYGLYLASRDRFVALLYRTVNGTFHRFIFHDVTVAGMGPSTVAAIVDSERGRAELFINGTSVGRRRLEREPEFQPQLHLLAVGGRPDNSVYNFRGTIADLLVTNVALPYDVIQSMSSASLTGQFQPSTVSRYCFMRAETGKYCHTNSRANNNFKCVDNATCVEDPSAPEPPTMPHPFDQFGPIGFCQ